MHEEIKKEINNVKPEFDRFTYVQEQYETARMKAKDAKKQSRHALCWSVTALVISMIALIIQILEVLE